MAPKRKGRAAAAAAAAQPEADEKSSSAAVNADTDSRMSDAPAAAAPAASALTAASTGGEDDNGDGDDANGGGDDAGGGEDEDGDGDGDGDDANGGSGGGGSSVLSKYQAAWSNGVRSKGLFSILLSRLPRDFSYDILSLIMSFDRESRVYTIDTSGHLSSWMIDPNAAIESIRRIAAAGLTAPAPEQEPDYIVRPRHLKPKPKPKSKPHPALTAVAAAGESETPIFCVINQSLIEPRKVELKARHKGDSARAKASKKRAVKRAKYESAVDTWHETTLLATEQYCIVSASEKHFRLFDVPAEAETVKLTKTRALVTGHTDAIPVVRFVERFNRIEASEKIQRLTSHIPYGLSVPTAVCLLPGLNGAAAPRLFASTVQYVSQSSRGANLSLFDLSTGAGDAPYNEVIVRCRPPDARSAPLYASAAATTKAECEKLLARTAVEVTATAAKLATHRTAYPTAIAQRTSGKRENKELWQLEDEAEKQTEKIAQLKALSERMDAIIARTTIRVPPPPRPVSSLSLMPAVSVAAKSLINAANRAYNWLTAPAASTAAAAAGGAARSAAVADLKSASKAGTETGAADVSEYTHYGVDVTALLPFPSHSTPSASADAAVDTSARKNWVIVGCRIGTPTNMPISLLLFDTASYTDVAVYVNKKLFVPTGRHNRGDAPASVPVAGRSIVTLHWYTPGRIFLAVTADGFLEAYQIADDGAGGVSFVLLSCLWAGLDRLCVYGAPMCVAGKLIIIPDWNQLRVFRLESDAGDDEGDGAGSNSSSSSKGEGRRGEYTLSADEKQAVKRAAASAWSLEPARYELRYVRQLVTEDEREGRFRLKADKIIALSDDCIATTERGGIRLWDVHQTATMTSRFTETAKFMATLFLSQGVRRDADLPVITKSIM